MLEVDSHNKTMVYKKNEKDETRGIKGYDDFKKPGMEKFKSF